MHRLQIPDLFRQVFTLVLFFAMAIVNIMSNANGGFNNKTPGYFANQYSTPLNPDGATFSVWGVIYFFVGVYAVYQALPSQRNAPYMRSVAPYVWLAFFTNSMWLLSWPYGGWWVSVVVIGVYLWSLVRVYQELDDYESNQEWFDWKRRICLRVGFSCNVSWVLVANLVNFTTVLKHEGYSATADWAVAWLLVAIAIAIYMALSRLDLAYCLVAVWALMGVARKQHQDAPVVSTVSYIGISLILAALGLAWLLYWRLSMFLVESPYLQTTESHDMNKPIQSSFQLSYANIE
eukprot:TRINITY_DN7543_c0_g1_i3.p1 TRINITY_DN7543_c0_g1~~TRINITY_DN7543_c0_g1_i3.p1  ORF type:complete len:291 (+),score=30.32 TRINITY_DN7543_c0_g1_i3:58-930(+)